MPHTSTHHSCTTAAAHATRIAAGLAATDNHSCPAACSHTRRSSSRRCRQHRSCLHCRDGQHSCDHCSCTQPSRKRRGRSRHRRKLSRLQSTEPQSRQPHMPHTVSVREGCPHRTRTSCVLTLGRASSALLPPLGSASHGRRLRWVLLDWTRSLLGAEPVPSRRPEPEISAPIRRKPAARVLHNTRHAQSVTQHSSPRPRGGFCSAVLSPRRG
jgi:hypothetical protein